MARVGVGRFRGYPVKRRRVEVAGTVLELIGPADYESLIDDPRVVRRFDEDEYLPYWAEFWPASLLLADAVAAWGPAADRHNQPTVLELGCGLGIVSLVALYLGYSVTASDYDADALAFVEESARQNALPRPTTRYIDWRQRHPDLRFDRIVAAEVLYETRNLQPIAEFVRDHLAERGFALICDANRTTADAFAAIAQRCGLSVKIQPVERPGPDAERIIRGRIFHLSRRGAAEDG